MQTTEAAVAITGLGAYAIILWWLVLNINMVW